MAHVIPFRTTRSGDWSDSERARLHELAQRFAGQTGIEVVFGKSDAGDPWCVVLDAQNEVLVHIARYEGRFVAHSAAEDFYAQAGDLKSAVNGLLGPKWQDERHDVVVPFAQGGRQAQIVTAVLVVASFLGHHQAEAKPWEDWNWAFGSDGKPGSGCSSQRTAESSLDLVATEAGSESAMTDLLSAPRDAGAIDPAAIDTTYHDFNENGGSSERILAEVLIGMSEGAEHPTLILPAGKPAADREIKGTDGGDILVGGVGDDVLDGVETLSGTADLLDGGAGDDRLLIDGGTVAIGGEGADSFVIQAAADDGRSRLYGILVDFDPSEDKILLEGDRPFSIVSSAPVENILEHVFGGTDNGLTLSGARVGIDVNGDGREDGYLLVGNASGDQSLFSALHMAANQAEAFLSPEPDPIAPGPLPQLV